MGGNKRGSDSDDDAAVANFMSKVATRRVAALPVSQISHKAAKRWSQLKGRVQGIAAFDGFHQGSVTVRQHRILISATRRLAAYVKRSGLELEGMFNLLDRDHSGAIDVQEFRLSVKRVIGLNFDNQTMEVMMQYM